MPSLVQTSRKTRRFISLSTRNFWSKTQECFDLGAAGQSRLMLLEMCGSIDFLNDWLESMVMAVQHANLDKEFLCAGSCNLCCYTREFDRHRVKIAGNYMLYQLNSPLLGQLGVFAGGHPFLWLNTEGGRGKGDLNIAGQCMLTQGLGNEVCESSLNSLFCSYIERFTHAHLLESFPKTCENKRVFCGAGQRFSRGEYWWDLQETPEIPEKFQTTTTRTATTMCLQCRWYMIWLDIDS